MGERDVVSRIVSIDKRGRFIVPKGVRVQLGLQAGDKLKVGLEGNRLVLKRKPAEIALGVAEVGRPMIRHPEELA